MSRFTDDLHLVDAAEFEPTMVSVLLRRAKLENAPRKQQVQVIRDWLKSHKPAPLIEHSIRMDGFGELLDHPQG